MTEVHNRRDSAPLQFGERLVGKRPVVAARPDVGAVQRRPITKKPDPELLHAVEVLAPAPVVTALFHLVHAPAAVANGRVAVLNAGRKQKRWAHHALFLPE